MAAARAARKRFLKLEADTASDRQHINAEPGAGDATRRAAGALKSEQQPGKTAGEDEEVRKVGSVALVHCKNAIASTGQEDYHLWPVEIEFTIPTFTFARNAGVIAYVRLSRAHHAQNIKGARTQKRC